MQADVFCSGGIAGGFQLAEGSIFILNGFGAFLILDEVSVFVVLPGSLVQLLGFLTGLLAAADFTGGPAALPAERLSVLVIVIAVFNQDLVGFSVLGNRFQGFNKVALCSANVLSSIIIPVKPSLSISTKVLYVANEVIFSKADLFI